MSAQAREYPPWTAMLDVDAVNYDPKRIVEVARHGPVVNLGSGVNQLPPPSHVLDTARATMTEAAFHHDYDGPAGHLLARAAVVAHERTLDARSRVGPENVLFTTGASAGLRLAAEVLARARPGARVLVPVPTYPLAAQCFVEAGLRVEEVWSPAGPGEPPAATAVARRVAGDVAAVYWNAFNNPTGTPLDDEGLLAVARACADHGAQLVIDRVSTDIWYDQPCSRMWPALAVAGLTETTLLVSSLSKRAAGRPLPASGSAPKHPQPPAALERTWNGVWTPSRRMGAVRSSRSRVGLVHVQPVNGQRQDPGDGHGAAHRRGSLEGAGVGRQLQQDPARVVTMSCPPERKRPGQRPHPTLAGMIRRDHRPSGHKGEVGIPRAGVRNGAAGRRT